MLTHLNHYHLLNRYHAGSAPAWGAQCPVTLHSAQGTWCRSSVRARPENLSQSPVPSLVLSPTSLRQGPPGQSLCLGSSAAFPVLDPALWVGPRCQGTPPALGQSYGVGAGSSSGPDSKNVCGDPAPCGHHLHRERGQGLCSDWLPGPLWDAGLGSAADFPGSAPPGNAFAFSV